MIGKLLIASLLSFGTGYVANEGVSSDVVEENTSSEEESSDTVITEEYDCYVTIVASKGGEILTDITEGNVGDVCTLYVGENLFYDLSSIEVNGVALIANEDKTYTFALVEGENVITSTFVINNEEVSSVLQTLEKAKNGDWSQIFNVDNVLTVVSWIITTLLSSGFFITLIRTRKIKAKTINEVHDAIKEVSESTVAEAIKNFLETTMGDSLTTITAKLDSTNEVCKVLARCFMLSQENTPESRLAIIKELTDLKTNEEELSNKIKLIISNQIEESNKIQEAKIAKLNELKKANDKIKTIKNEDNLKGSY